MQTEPTVSVIISAYNRPLVVSYAIKSVLNSDFDDFELIVIGDGCNEATEQAIHRFTDPRISFFNLPANTGSQSEPHNEGVRRARGEYILFLNQDDMYFPDHISQSVRFMEESDAEVAWSPVLLARKLVSTSGPIDAENDIIDLDGAIYGDKFDPTRFIISSCWILRRETALAVGPWLPIEDTRLSPSQEWLFRAYCQGRRLAYRRRISVICIHSGVRRYSYVSPRSIEHERAWDMICSGPTGQAEILEALAIRQAGEILRQSRKRPFKGFLAFAGAQLAKARIHPHTFKRFLKGMGRGRFVLDHRKFTSEPPRLPPDALVVLGDAGADGFFGAGWHGPEAGGRWTSSRTAELFFSLPDGWQEGAIELRGYPLRRGETVAFTIDNGEPVLSTFEGEGVVRLAIDSAKPHCLQISIDAPATPKTVELSDDERTLRFFAKSIALVENRARS